MRYCVPTTTPTEQTATNAGGVMGNNAYGEDSNAYISEMVETTIFSTVITLCFCTVFCFLGYLLFKRRLNRLQRKRNLEPPRYQLELGMQNDNNNNSKSMPKTTTHMSHVPSKSSLTTNKSNNTLTVNYFQSPNSRNFHQHKYHQSITPEQLNYDLAHYKDGSDSHFDNSKSHSINISVMNLNKEIDCTPTPNVSPNEYHNKNKENNINIDHGIINDDMDVDEIYTNNANEGNQNIYNTAKNNHLTTRLDNNGYKWIKQTLTKVDSQYYDEYLENFEKHKVKDHRLGDLTSEDWKELIPAIGPRNDFKRIWKTVQHDENENETETETDNETNAGKSYGHRHENSNLTDDNNGEFEHEFYNEETINDSDIPQDLQSALLSELNSDNGDENDEIDEIMDDDFDDDFDQQIITNIKMPKMHDDFDEIHMDHNNNFLRVELHDNNTLNSTTPTTQFDDETDTDDISESKESYNDEYYDENTSDDDIIDENDNKHIHIKEMSPTLTLTLTHEEENENENEKAVTFDEMSNKYGGKNNKSKKKNDKQSVLSALSSAVSNNSNTESSLTDSYSIHSQSDNTNDTNENEYKYKSKQHKFKSKHANPIPEPIAEEPDDFDDEFDENFDIDKPLNFDNKISNSYSESKSQNNESINQSEKSEKSEKKCESKTKTKTETEPEIESKSKPKPKPKSEPFSSMDWNNTKFIFISYFNLGHSTNITNINNIIPGL